jgi:endonuclease/exonuclease/phosphatase family metal-dependent hydrolase
MFMRSYLLALLLIPAGALAQERIIVDGVFDDWSSAHLVHEEQDISGPGVHFTRLWAAAEDEYVFLSFQLSEETRLQETNDLVLYIDTDQDPSTGLAVNGIGAELVWRFGQRSGQWYGGGAPLQVRHRDLDLFTGPTVTSTRFEMAMRLDATISGNAIFSSETVSVVLGDVAHGNFLPADGGAEISLAPSTPPPFEVQFDREDDTHLRLVSYNVWNDGIFLPARQAAYTRILRALEPDVIAFQEIYNSTPELVLAKVEEFLPSPAGQQWFVSQADASDIYLASRYPIVYTEALCRSTAPTSCNGAFRLDLSASYTQDLYVVNAHTPCCTNDETRQLEIDQMMAHLRDARQDDRLPENTPFVLTGDMNLVGYARQLETLRTGDIVNTGIWGPPFAPDWDGSDLADAVPLTTHMPAAFTWYNPNSGYHPGRLDVMIYSNSVADLGNHFVLFTPQLPQDILSAYQLSASDTQVASDHLPVVADFALAPTGVSTAPAGPAGGLSVGAPYPNPTTGSIRLPLAVPGHETVDLRVFDILGRTVWAGDHPRPGASREILLDLTALPAGVYIIRLATEREVVMRRIVVQR